MENVSFATAMYGLAHLCESVMSATTDLTKVAVPSVVDQVCQMPTTARNVQSWRKM